MPSSESIFGDEGEFDRDVVIVGGGPSGCSAAVFTARFGLDTVVFDRGKAALRRAAFVENYLGFPAGIDIDSLYDRMHDHLQEVGADYVPDMVTTVRRPDESGVVDGESGFVVETQDDRTVTTRFVVAASWYDGSYLRSVAGDDAFELHDHGDGDEHEHFDSDYADHDGRTPVDGLYVAAPAGDENAQAIIAAGHGAQVARSLIEDVRLSAGYPESLASHHDWLRRRAELEGEWLEHDRWRDWFHDRLPDDHDIAEDRVDALREGYLDRAMQTIRTADEVETLRELAQDRLLDHIDEGRILERAREIEAEEA